MTRAKDISKILTDADLSGTLDVTGTFTSQGIDDNADATAITIDSSENVGIGGVPNNWGGMNRTLELIGSSDVQLAIHANSDSLSNDGRIGEVAFLAGTTNTLPNVATIVGRVSGTDEAKGSLTFHCRDTDTAGLPQERVRIDSSGNVGIGLSSPQELLHLKDGSIAVGNGTASNNAVIGRIGFSTDSSNSRFIGIESFRGGDAANADLRFHTFGGDGDNGERMRIDTAGRIGIGDSSPDGLLTIKGDSNSSSQPSIRLKDGTDAREAFVTNQSGDLIIGTSNSSDDVVDSSINILTSMMIFKPENTERMRITDDTVGVFTTDQVARLCVESNFSVSTGINVKNNNSSAGGVFINFSNYQASQAGSISHSGSTSVSYNTSSDYRLKENVTADWDATTRLKQLNPVRFNFIADADTTVDGFLAHEVQSVVPEAITGTHNEVDADGNPVYQGIDQSKLVPLLVKTIQELEARIVALETA